MATAAPITGASTRAPSIDRRHLFGSLALLPALALMPAAIAASGLTPFRIAEARYLAARTRFNSLPYNLEGTNLAQFEHEERLLSDANEAVEMAPIADLREFAMAFIVAHDDGWCQPGRSTLLKLVADAKRLIGAA